jgi:tetratricopeptide (TPR) repeat protein
MLRQKEQAFAPLLRALALDPNNPDFLFKEAEINSQFGSTEQAFAALESAIQRGYSQFFARDHPIFNNLHKDERFRKLVSNQPQSH